VEVLLISDSSVSDMTPWVRYRELLDIDDIPPDAPLAANARLVMENSPQVMALLQDVLSWPGTVVNSHKSASQTFHSLGFLATLGVSPSHPAISFALDRILERMGPDGFPRLPMMYPVHFGGPGVETWSWALCDAPVILAALVKFGYGCNQKVREGVHGVMSLAEPFGWPCAVAPELGSFRGPGKKTDPCPYATLVSLELAAACVATNDGEYTDLVTNMNVMAGIEALLSCWERSRDWHPYIFYMGDDFRKLKAPLLWYDILHVLDVLSRFPVARQDRRFMEMLEVVHGKRGKDGLYTPESVYQPYRAWDFGQKKVPSPWITFIIKRIENRL